MCIRDSSKDSGATFSLPIRVDDGNPLGRVDIVLLSDKKALVSWLEKTEDKAAIKAVKVSLKGKIGNSFLVAESNDSRQSGFPVMAKHNHQVIFAWTKKDSLTRVNSAVMNVY